MLPICPVCVEFHPKFCPWLAWTYMWLWRYVGFKSGPCHGATFIRLWADFVGGCCGQVFLPGLLISTNHLALSWLGRVTGQEVGITHASYAPPGGGLSIAWCRVVMLDGHLWKQTSHTSWVLLLFINWKFHVDLLYLITVLSVWTGYIIKFVPPPPVRCLSKVWKSTRVKILLGLPHDEQLKWMPCSSVKWTAYSCHESHCISWNLRLLTVWGQPTKLQRVCSSWGWMQVGKKAHLAHSSLPLPWEPLHFLLHILVGLGTHSVLMCSWAYLWALSLMRNRSCHCCCQC